MNIKSNFEILNSTPIFFPIQISIKFKFYVVLLSKSQICEAFLSTTTSHHLSIIKYFSQGKPISLTN